MAQRLGGYKGANMPIPYEKLTYNDILHHKEAYDCFNRAGKELFSEWDIVGFEKAVLGCGDSHFLYMAEKIKETPNLYGELNKKMPFLRFREEGQHFGYELFLSPPPFWGSRGAPLWWAYVARKLTSYALPMDEQELFDVYSDTAKEFGINMKYDEPYYIKRFAAGGMSSGVVTGEFVRKGWYVIRDRNRLYSKPLIKTSGLYLEKAKERIIWYCDQFKGGAFEIVPVLDEDDFIFAINDCKCNDHQREVALTLWGVYTGTPLSISELAKKNGVTYNSIRQIEKRFLQHILTNRNRETIIRPK